MSELPTPKQVKNGKSTWEDDLPKHLCSVLEAYASGKLIPAPTREELEKVLPDKRKCKCNEHYPNCNCYDVELANQMRQSCIEALLKRWGCHDK